MIRLQSPSLYTLSYSVNGCEFPQQGSDLGWGLTQEWLGGPLRPILKELAARSFLWAALPTGPCMRSGGWGAHLHTHHVVAVEEELDWDYKRKTHLPKQLKDISTWSWQSMGNVYKIGLKNVKLLDQVSTNIYFRFYISIITRLWIQQEKPKQLGVAFLLLS